MLGRGRETSTDDETLQQGGSYSDSSGSMGNGMLTRRKAAKLQTGKGWDSLVQITQFLALDALQAFPVSLC